MFTIKWTNKYSGETGFVKSVSNKEKHFNNTFDLGEARSYKSEKKACEIIKSLIDMGEGLNNNFEIINSLPVNK